MGGSWRDICPERLTPILDRYLAGELSPPMAAMHLLIAAEDADRVVAILDRSATTASPVETAALAELHRLIADHIEGARRAAALLRAGADHGRRAASPEDGIAAFRDLFDRAVDHSPEASVALYSLGSPDLLDRATAEVIARMRDWNLLGCDRHLLEIGCGIGRFAVALAPQVASITGIDISERMIEEARRRCRRLLNVRLATCSGRDLSSFAEASIDLVFAVDTFPYLVLSGGDLVARHFHEVARVVKPGGSFLILNFSYRNDVDIDRTEIAALADQVGLVIARSGTRDLTLWDGTTFLMKR